MMLTLPPAGRSDSGPPLLLRRERRQGDLAVLHLHEEDARPALPTLLARGAVLVELDGAVDPDDAHLPQGLAHRLRVRLARELEPLHRGHDPVVPAEALGEALERMAALVPLVDEGLGE